jgi:glycosyltransferase involved in cell wall biosynthesis
VKLSFCIPNFNYERYLGRTIASALAADVPPHVTLEVVVNDNASTDGSVALVQALQDRRVRVHVNACNVGFAGNLDRAVSLSTGEWLVLLSSDDLVRPAAGARYAQVIEALGGDCRTLITSTMDEIDADDVVTGRIGPDPDLWHASDRDAALEAVVGAPVYNVAARELLRRCVTTMKNPCNFAATCYRRADWLAVEGYGGARLINPDKWFHWRLLGALDRAVFIDTPLFAYRVHAQNQGAQQAKAGALKFLVDEYASVLELDASLLQALGLTRADMEAAFVERDIGRHGLATLARGDRAKAQRILDFGRATYPQLTRDNTKARALASLLLGGVVGEHVARVGYALWQRRAEGA